MREASESTPLQTYLPPHLCPLQHADSPPSYEDRIDHIWLELKFPRTPFDL